MTDEPIQAEVTEAPNGRLNAAAKMAAILDSSPKAALKKAAGVIIPTTAVTSGVSIFLHSGWFSSYQQPLGESLVNSTAIIASHTSVWGVATAGALAGWNIGKKFDGGSHGDMGVKSNPRAWAMAAGLLIMAGTYSFPLAGKIYDGVHDGLSKTFNIQQAKPASQNLGMVQDGDVFVVNRAPAPTLG